MEEMNGPYVVRPAAKGHIYLMSTIGITVGGDGKTKVDSRDWKDSTKVGMSDELMAFIDRCVGLVEVEKETIRLVLHDKRDYVRFVLEGWLDAEAQPTANL